MSRPFNQTVVGLCRSVTKMSAKCYAKGSVAPPSRKPGDLRVYSMRFCPFAKRVLLVLAAKKIPYEAVNINLDEKPEWYLDMYPSGKVPVLESDGVLLSESLIISEYLDEVYPGEKLTPADAYKKAKQKMFMEVTCSKVVTMILKAVKNVAGAFEDSEKNFAEMEAELKNRDAPFFGGDKPGMLDLMIWPWFEVLAVIHHRYGEEFVMASVLPKEKFPLLNCWIGELLKYPPVKELYNPKSLSLFLASTKAEKKDFDIGL